MHFSRLPIEIHYEMASFLSRRMLLCLELVCVQLRDLVQKQFSNSTRGPFICLRSVLDMREVNSYKEDISIYEVDEIYGKEFDKYDQAMLWLQPFYVRSEESHFDWSFCTSQFDSVKSINHIWSNGNLHINFWLPGHYYGDKHATATAQDLIRAVGKCEQLYLKFDNGLPANVSSNDLLDCTNLTLHFKIAKSNWSSIIGWLESPNVGAIACTLNVPLSERRLSICCMLLKDMHDIAELVGALRKRLVSDCRIRPAMPSRVEFWGFDATNIRTSGVTFEKERNIHTGGVAHCWYDQQKLPPVLVFTYKL